MRVDQIVVSASPGDAITNFALALRAGLRQEVPSDLYAHFFDPEHVPYVRPLDAYTGRRQASPDLDVLVVHASIGQPEVAAFVLSRPERLVIVFHNITPSELLRPYDPGFARLLDSGREELARLLDRASRVLTVSRYNATELSALGHPGASVLPLAVDVNKLNAAPDSKAMSRKLEALGTGPLVVSVGQLLPHKRADYLVEAFSILSRYLIPGARLVLVGAKRLPVYSAILQQQIDELGLESAWLPGSIPLDALATLFRRADVFATASEHEGFCVPLLEAMAFDVPVLGRRFAAVPETAGSAALILEPDDGPSVAAEAMAALTREAGLRRALVGRGCLRLNEFDFGRALGRWHQELLGVASA